MTTTKNTTETFRGANLYVARPARLYGCHWCGAVNRANTFCGCAASRNAHNERPITPRSVDAIELTF